MLKRLTSSWILLWPLVLAACGWLPKRDAEQPLLPHSRFVPADAVLTSAAADEAISREALLASFEETHGALSGWTITGYADFSAYLNIKDLVESVEHWNRNAYAYFLLGPYLAMNYRPRAALRAGQRALALFNEQRTNPALEGLYPHELPALMAINLARYHILLGNYDNAKLTVEPLLADPNQDPLFRLAAEWLLVEAFIGLKNLSAASEALRVSQSIEVPGDSADADIWARDYAHFFSKRRAYEAYYQGLIDFAGGDYAAATANFTTALQGRRGLYAAAFTLAVTEAAVGEAAAAASRLDGLERGLPFAPACGFLRRGSFRGQERISFNRAVFEEQAGNLARAEKSYRRAIEVAACTNQGFNRDVKRNILDRLMCGAESKTADICEIIRSSVAENDGEFPEAQNNLGQLLMRRMDNEELTGAERREFAREAEQHLRKAAFNARYTTPELPIHALVRLYTRRPPSGGAILELGELAVKTRTDDQALATLVTRAAREAESVPERAHAFAILAAIAANSPGWVSALRKDTSWKLQLSHLRRSPTYVEQADHSLAVLLDATQGSASRELQNVLERYPGKPWALVGQALSALELDAESSWRSAIRTAHEVTQPIIARPPKDRTLGEIATVRLAERLRIIATQIQNVTQEGGPETTTHGQGVPDDP